jgi:hypothetical protein
MRSPCPSGEGILARYQLETDLDRPGLYAALSRFIECTVKREVEPGNRCGPLAARSDSGG